MSVRTFPIRGRRVLRLILGAAFPLTAAAQRGDAFDTKLRSPSEERALFHVPPGFEIQLVSAEPDIQKPMNLAFDSAGRVWVTGSVLYPWPARRDAAGERIASFEKNWDDNHLAFRAAAMPPEPAEHGADSVRILSDFGPDGRARKVVVFADGLNIPIGVLPLPRDRSLRGESALVFSIPAIWRLTDTDGDGRADRREKLYDGFGFKDTHGMSSSYWLWHDGWVYGTHGFANASEVIDRHGRVVKLTSGNTYRFRPDGSRFELYVRGQTNPFGLAFDRRGDVFTADSHSKPVYLLLPGGHYEGINREHDGLGFGPAITTDDHGSSAIAGLAHYSGTQFPREFQDNLFNGNPVTRRINRTRLEWRGSSPQAVRQPDFLSSEDPAFRPVQVKLGPDGALWIADFYNPIIGHYEVPLTHPSRDRSHGRIWRIVWRGLDGSVPAPSLPNLTRLDTRVVAGRLTDPNVVLRSLAVEELVARSDASTTVSALRSVAAALISGHDPTADETAALPVLMALERLGQSDEGLLRRALTRPGSEVALAALRVFTLREKLPPDLERLLTEMLGLQLRDDVSNATPAARPGTGNERSAPGHTWRAIATLLTARPQPWSGPLLLAMLARAPEADFELMYALRVALKTQALEADPETLRAWAANSAAAERVADACVAVPSPAAAEFLLAHLERTKFAGTRAGEYARHAVLHLPEERFAAAQPLLESLSRAPRTQRVAFAEGLATLAAKPGRTLPPEIETWMQAELVAAIADKDQPLALRAINAAKPLSLPSKSAPLRQVALDSSRREPNRIAALRALATDDPGTESVLVEVLGMNGSNTLRRTAAELLGTASPSAAARTALTEAFKTASADLALGLATALAKSEAGASDLLDLAAAGRVRPTLLRHRHLVVALEKRSPALRERAATLTRSLPAEDARLDALIAQRVTAAPALKTDVTRGATLFAKNCATCHRFHNEGGNIGPTLDGASARSIARLVEDILDPSRNIDPAFRLTTVALKNGESKAGLNLREEADRVLLTDAANGETLEIPRSSIVEVTPSPISAMPAVFETVLSEQDLLDVVAFLRK